MVSLSGRQPLFVGLKLDGSLRRRLESLTGPDRRYIFDESLEFLTICRLGEDYYVGKIVTDRLTTDRVEDVRRNVLSILQRLCPETRFPPHLEIFPCEPIDPGGTG
jgi:hypothetical protein